MYVKVSIKNYQLFREDNGSLIGEAVFPLLDPGRSIYKSNGKITTLLYVYMDADNSFIELCTGTNCSFECLSKELPECRYSSKYSTQGYYIDI